jgi:hypothetical protein
MHRSTLSTSLDVYGLLVTKVRSLLHPNRHFFFFLSVDITTGIVVITEIYLQQIMLLYCYTQKIEGNAPDSFS